MYFSVVSSPAQADLSPAKSNKKHTNFINICNFIDHLSMHCIQNYLSANDHFCCECRLSFVTTAKMITGKPANITASQMHPDAEVRSHPSGQPFYFRRYDNSAGTILVIYIG